VFNFAQFKKNFTVDVTKREPDTMEMELKGIDASISNALRRIIIAEIPTMAFHKVFLYQNTSVLPDELLVHRIGLLPLLV
jgi:DNA-directed RNA polymerase I and III subunit RPAC1